MFDIYSLAQCVKGMLAFAIYITHGLACYVAIDITWTDYLVKRFGSSPRKVFWEYVVRTVLVLITCKLKSHTHTHPPCLLLLSGSDYVFVLLFVAQFYWPLPFQIWNCSSRYLEHYVCPHWVWLFRH